MKKIVLALLPICLLASCKANDLVDYKIDHSTVWKDNFWNRWEINKDNYTLKESRALDLSNDKVFTAYGDSNFAIVEPEYAKYNYIGEYENGYGENHKLSSNNNAIKEGFISKLYDGKMSCMGRYEKVRVQIGEEGFSTSFKGYKANDASYFAINFKSALDFKNATPGIHLSNVKLCINLFYEQNNLKERREYFYEVTDIISNTEVYTFFGFSFNNILNKNIVGYSLSYELTKDAYNDEHEEKLSHALLLYEVLMPKTNWKK